LDARDESPTNILDRFDVAVSSCISMAGAGGFSGARLWRVASSCGLLVLRRWPAGHPTPDRLAWIHSVIRVAQQHGFDRVPTPLDATTGGTFVSENDHLWELDRWLPGVADFHARPTDARLVAAMLALAGFHRSVEHVASTNQHADGVELIARPETMPSPGVAERLARIAWLREGGLTKIDQAIPRPATTRLARLAREWVTRYRRLADRIERRMAVAAALRVPLQPVLRDVWSDHILFDGDAVTGILDVGAMRIESPAADLARLIGSLVGDDRQRRQVALAAYATRRPLSHDERQLVTAFDESAVALSGLNWVEWLFVDGRRFNDLAAVERRLAEGLLRVDALARRATT
jgi:homoserine kinase type II